MKISYTFILLFSCIIIYACSTSTETRKIVQNKSSYGIKVSVFNRYTPDKPQANYEVLSNDNAVLSNINSNSGSIYNSRESCVNPDDSIVLEVLSNPALKVTFEINDSENWTYSRISENSRKVEDECRATITDADIVPK